MPDPEHTVAEMARVASSATCSCRVPREPLWRGLNMARGAYLQGPRQHARAPQPLVQARFVALLSRHGDGRRGALAVPVDHAACPARRLSAPHRGGARGRARAPRLRRGARILSVGIASTGRLHVRLLLGRLARRCEVDDYGASSLLWSVMFVVISVIYRPIEQLLSRTIADRRARGLDAAIRCACRCCIQATFAPLFLVVALALRGPIQDDAVRRVARRCTGSSSSAALAYAASYFARGWLAGHQWFGLYGGLVLFESISRFLFALAVAVGIASGRPRWRWASRRRRSSRSWSCRWAFARRASRRRSTRRGRRGAARAARAAAASPVASLAIMLAEQTLLNAAVLIVDATPRTPRWPASSSTCC